MTHPTIVATAHNIVRNYSWVADRDIPAEGMTTEEVFGWYVTEAAARVFRRRAGCHRRSPHQP